MRRLPIDDWAFAAITGSLIVAEVPRDAVCRFDNDSRR